MMTTLGSWQHKSDHVTTNKDGIQTTVFRASDCDGGICGTPETWPCCCCCSCCVSRKTQDTVTKIIRYILCCWVCPEGQCCNPDRVGHTQESYKYSDQKENQKRKDERDRRAQLTQEQKDVEDKEKAEKIEKDREERDRQIEACKKLGEQLSWDYNNDPATILKRIENNVKNLTLDSR